MFCPECGTQIQDGARFCFSCGKPVTGSAPASGSDLGIQEAPGIRESPDSLDVDETLTPDLEERTVLRGKYEIQRELGRGGMGVVYLAHDLDLPPTSPRYAVAVKMLPPALARDERWMKRLVAEFDAAAQLRSPHIVLVYSFSVDDHTGAPFIVMEYVEGASLDRVLDTRGRLDEEETLALAEAVAAGLGEAHERGLIHRDFKPGNVLVPQEGGLAAAKVADFGLARTVQSGVTRLTGRAAPSGTLLYNSPEQHRGSRSLDARGDLYSFAATLYECLAGVSLVNPEGDIAWQVTQGLPEPIEDVSPPLFAALCRALSKDKEERFETVAAFVEALRLRKAAVTLPKGWSSEVRRVTVATPGRDEWREITYYRNSLGMEFVLIPAGEFLMGSPEDEEGRSGGEGPVHRVRITRPFYLGVTPVAQSQYEQVMGSNPSYFKGPNRPVETVSWNDAQAFVRKLSEAEGVPVGMYRLPTEAEWEYACRAGSETAYYSGNHRSDLQRIAWYVENSDKETHDVAQLLPNGFGLYDMSGNVYEWCQDWYDNGYYAKSPEVDPPGPHSGGSRVLRGGSWNCLARYCRSALRDYRFDPTITSNDYGFRVAVSPPPQE